MTVRACDLLQIGAHVPGQLALAIVLGDDDVHALLQRPEHEPRTASDREQQGAAHAETKCKPATDRHSLQAAHAYLQ